MSQAVCLDDLEIRHQAFKEKYGTQFHQVEHCYNVAQFVHFMTTYPGVVDFVSLDHDLGDSAEPILRGTGMDAARLLCLMSEMFRPKKVNVHSHNYPRQEAMTHFLRTNGYPDATDEHFTDE